MQTRSKIGSTLFKVKNSISFLILSAETVNDMTRLQFTNFDPLVQHGFYVTL